MNIYTLAQMDSTVSHLNEILNGKGIRSFYLLAEVKGVDRFCLWLVTPKDTHKICSSDSATMYQSIVAIKHVHQNL